MNDSNPYASPEAPDPNDQRLVTIASFSDPTSANIARSVLDSEGIAACLGAETTNTVLNYYGSALGGVKLMVFEDQAEKAKAILAAHSAADFSDSDAQEQLDDDEEEDSPAQRERDEHIRRAWMAAVLGLILCPPLLNMYSMYLLFRHGLLVDEPQYRPNWRTTAAIAVNLFALVLGIGFWWRGLGFISLVDAVGSASSAATVGQCLMLR